MKTPFLNTAKLLYKIIVFSILFTFLMIFVSNITGMNDRVKDLLIGLPFIAVIFISPAGLIFILLSYIRKEENSKQKFLYLLGMLFFTLISAGMVMAVLNDLRIFL